MCLSLAQPLFFRRSLGKTCIAIGNSFVRSRKFFILVVLLVPILDFPVSITRTRTILNEGFIRGRPIVNNYSRKKSIAGV